MLAVLANKMIHSELYDPEYVYEINAKKLYQKYTRHAIMLHQKDVVHRSYRRCQLRHWLRRRLGCCRHHQEVSFDFRSQLLLK